MAFGVFQVQVEVWMTLWGHFECAMYVCGGGSQCSWGDAGLLGTMRESRARPFPAPSPKIGTRQEEAAKKE